MSGDKLRAMGWRPRIGLARGPCRRLRGVPRSGVGHRHSPMTENEGKKIAANKRAARLEVELRANLKKRKELAKARSRPAEAPAPDHKPHEDGGE